ncbi:MAG: ubiquitin-activating E1 FCCH domain-containing protein [Pseudomonadota bacterium]
MTEYFKTTFAVHEESLDLIVGPDQYLKLFVNDYEPDSDMEPEDFTEAAGGGYAHKVLKGTETKTAVDIEGLSRANPCVVTWTAHNLESGDMVTIEDIEQADWTALNDEHEITYINANSFSIAVDTSGYGADYVPGTDPGTIIDSSDSDWTLEENDPRDVITAEQTFEFSGALTDDATVYGWYLITKDLATIKGAKRLDATYQPAAGGGELRFTPRPQAGNGVPS